LGRRLPLPATDRDEIRSIAQAFNGALDRLESGFSVLDQFATEASHELRTPLTVVAAELDVMLQHSRTASEWEAAARVSLREIRHLSRLVDALLAIASSQHGPAQGQRADLALVIADVVAASAPLARSRGIQLRLGELRADAPTFVSGDADALAGALSAVVENALQHTPVGGEVVLRCERDEARVSVHVDDSGPGVAPDEWQWIFEPFARGKVGQASANGVGLGLTIARRICERSGGALIVGRSPRGGARFSFSFPIQLEAATQSAGG
jgi:signal transduction histidine kinase